MTRPRLLDLFCGAGGCGAGYHRAGFDVIGVDFAPQPRYPFEFHRADALEFLRQHGHMFDAIHASPPCQRYSTGCKGTPGLADTKPDLVPPTQSLLRELGRPYVIENVVGAPLFPAIMLCGSMFGLLVERHRLFESSLLLLQPGPCRHGVFEGDFPSGRSWSGPRAGERSRVVHVYGNGGSRGTKALWSKAMGIDWMTTRELAQAIPPAYTEFIGRQLLRAIGGNQ